MKHKSHSRAFTPFCHAELPLLSICSTFKKQGVDPEQRPFRMTLCSKGAFTLIELLVVVLIIGILAAVAVPQYQKAVQKARLTEAITVLKSLSQAADVWVLANNPSGDTVDLTNSLDIEVPTSDHWTYSAYWEPGDPSMMGEYWGANAQTEGLEVILYRDYYLDQKKWMWGCVGSEEDNTCTLFNQLVGND